MPSRFPCEKKVGDWIYTERRGSETEAEAELMQPETR